jgi:hypothetical protein
MYNSLFYAQFREFTFLLASTISVTLNPVEMTLTLTMIHHQKVALRQAKNVRFSTSRMPLQLLLTGQLGRSWCLHVSMVT